MRTKKINIFYSWQSDLNEKTNKIAIRRFIEEAIKRIKQNDDDIEIIIDEDARGNPGSKNIAEELMRKIRNSDIFIADVSIINGDGGGLRKTPNPNVLYELGFASSRLGWDRILLIFNDDCGCNVEDLPFDIRGHKVMKYLIKSTCSKDEVKDKIKGYSYNLEETIRLILKDNPEKEWDKKEKTDSDIKRERDIVEISKIMEGFNIEVFKKFIDLLPEKICEDIFYFDDILSCYLKSPIPTKLFDEELQNLFYEFYYLLSLLLGQDRHYNSNFSLNFHNSISTDERNGFIQEMNKIKQDFIKCLNNILDILKNRYIEIDFYENDKRTLNAFLEYIKETYKKYS